MDIVDTKPLPVIHYAIDVAYHPNHLGHVMVDGRIQDRRRSLVTRYRSTKHAASRRRTSYLPGGFEFSSDQGRAKNGYPHQE
jgi:hypothetical protein